MAVALCLIVSELLTNSLRHAFSECDTGNIEISYTGKAEAFTFSVADDGCGLPDGFDLSQGGGLGTKIVRLYSTQLGGKLTHGENGDSGARFTLTVEG